MIISKIIPEDYNTAADVEKLIRYILKDKSFDRGYHTNTYIGGLNIFNVYNAAEEFAIVRNYFGKNDGRLVRHILLSPEPRDLFTGDMLYTLALAVSSYYCSRYQIVFGVHTDEKSHPHIHFALNTVSFVDGKKLHDSIAEQIAFSKFSEQCYVQIKREYAWVKKQLGSF